MLGPGFEETQQSPMVLSGPRAVPDEGVAFVKPAPKTTTKPIYTKTIGDCCFSSKPGPSILRVPLSS